MSDNIERADMEFLARRGEFQRFMWRVIQASGLLSRTTDGSEGRNLAYDEGRRNLGLDILDMAEKGQPIPDAHPDGALLTLIQVLREETQKPPTEKPNATRNRPDRYSELRDTDTDADAVGAE